MLEPKHVIHNYLRAKDENRPYLMATAFAPDAVFRTSFLFDSDFDGGSDDDNRSEGLEAVTGVFRQLGALCENIFTVCTEDSVEVDDEGALRCKWVVTMSERETRRVRVGWGDYVWRFDGSTGLAKELHVTMARMVQLEPSASADVFGWVSGLPVWVSTPALLERAPRLEGLETFRPYFG